MPASVRSRRASLFSSHNAPSPPTIITNALIRTTQFRCDEAGNHTRTLDAGNHAQTITSGAEANTTTITEPSGVASSRVHDAANRLLTTTVPNNKTTTYGYDAVGNRTSITDPLGFKTTTTPNALDLPETVTHRDSTQKVLATTTNTYDNTERLQAWVTFDPVYTLTLTTTLGYNANGYLIQDNLSHKGALVSRSLTSTLAYYDDSLVQRIYQQGQPTRQVYYDDAGRVICSDFGQVLYLKYDSSGRRIERYNEYPDGSTCGMAVQNPAWPYQYGHGNYFWDGPRLIVEDSHRCVGGGCRPGSYYTRTLTYDGEGNVTQMRWLEPTSVVTITYTWEPGTRRMVAVSRRGYSTVTFDATLEYDRLNRVTRMCSVGYNIGYNCQNLYYVGDSDWLSFVTSDAGGVLQQYLYANGRPVRLRVYTGVPAYYRYNWHGDVVGFVASNGDGMPIWQNYDGWGGLADRFPGQYYNWNGAWGYLKVRGEFNYRANGLFYIHGRWYNPDTALFLSPDEKGEYFYGSGQDGVNDVWLVNAATAFGKSGPIGEAIVLGGGRFLRDTAWASYQAFYPPPEWTLEDRIGNAARVTIPVVAAEGVEVISKMV